MIMKMKTLNEFEFEFVKPNHRQIDQRVTVAVVVVVMAGDPAAVAAAVVLGAVAIILIIH